MHAAVAPEGLVGAFERRGGASTSVPDALDRVASPALLQNDLNPIYAGQILGAFTGGGNQLTRDSNAATGIGVELPITTTAVTPISDPVLFDYDNFWLTLTIQASGTPLVVDDAGCDFNFPNTPVSIPQNP